MDAVSVWTEAVRRQPVNPQAHYLLGAELAHMERYGDAVVHFTHAVEQAPQLLAARVQLALLWLTLQSTAQAESVSAALIDLPDDNAYHHIGRALTALCRGQRAEAIESLRIMQGMAIDNAPLAADMAMLLKSLGEQVQPAAGATNGEVDHRVAISVYAGRRT